VISTILDRLNFPIDLRKFIIIGIINTLVAYIVFLLLLNFKINYKVANILSYIIGMINSFLFNKKWTFQFSNKTTFSLVTKFVFVNLVSLSLGLLTIIFLVEVFDFTDYFAQLFSISVSVLINYFGQKKIVFINE